MMFIIHTQAIYHTMMPQMISSGDSFMAKFIFSGTIHPERAPFHMNAPVTAEIQLPGIGVMIKAIAQIIRNQIFVTADVIGGDIDIATLKNVIYDFIRNLTESFGIMFAMAHSVEITSITNIENNDIFVFGVDMKDVVDVGDWALADTSKVTTVIGANPFIRRAVTDVIDAIRRADDTGFLCYRQGCSTLRSPDRSWRDAG